MKNKIILYAFILGLFSITNGQEKNKNISLNIKLPSSVKIIGTSTLHDWESIVEKTDAQISINSLKDVSIETLNVTVDVFSIKSGKKIMDKLTYKALKAEEHPKILFVFKKGTIVNQNESFIDIELNGDLTIAGMTKNVTVLTKINKNGNNIVLTGSHKLKMTTFGIDPPTALLGTIKTGDEITIEFSLKF